MYVSGLAWVCCLLVLAGSADDFDKEGPTGIDLVESHLNVLSIKSDNNIQIDFAQNNPRRTISIFLSMTKYEGESEIVATGLGDNVAIVSRDKIDLNASQPHYISIFRKDNVLAVYRAGQLRPVLVYVYKGNEKINFSNFKHASYYGPRRRSSILEVSLQEDTVKVDAMAEPHGDAIRNELEAVRGEVNRRLRILDEFLKKRKVHELSISTVEAVVRVINENLFKQLALLDYYGIKLEGKYQQYREAIVRTAYPIMMTRRRWLWKHGK